MPSRRRVLQVWAIGAAILAGCSTDESSNGATERAESAASVEFTNGSEAGTTTSPIPGTTTAAPYSVDDLVVSNWTDRTQEVTITVNPAANDGESLVGRVTLSPTESDDSKIAHPDLEAMDGEATVTIEVADLGTRSHEWDGDAGDDHRGLTVIIRSDEIEFHEKVA